MYVTNHVKRGRAQTIYFPLIVAGEANFATAAAYTHAAGDTQISIDGGAFANATNAPAHEGNGVWSLALTDAETQGQTVVVTVIDSATKAVEDQSIVVTTETGGGVFASDIATLASQTSFTLAEGSADDDAYNGWAVLITDAASRVQQQLGVVTDYVGSTKTVTLQAAPGVFTTAAGDYVELIPGFLTSAIDANVTQISGDATAANNLEADYDGTGYAKVNSTIGTTTTNTDMRGTDSAALASTLDSVAGAGFVTGTDSLEAIRNRGDAAWLTGAGGSSPTVEQIRTEIDANSTQLAAIVADTGTTLPAQLDAIAGAGFVTGTDSLEAIRNRGDAAWTTGAGGSSPTVEEIRAEIDSNSTQLAAILLDTGTSLPALIAALNDLSAAQVNSEVDTAIQDAFNFTGGNVDANAEAINGVALTGDGSATPFDV